MMSMRGCPTDQLSVAPLIAAIGEPDFAARVAALLRDQLDFELSAMIVHRADAPPKLIHDNFDRADAREGVRNYVRFTHSINPILQNRRRPGVWRARDFAMHAVSAQGRISDLIVLSNREELGFRTVGWPARLEEIGLHFQALGGMVEIGLYRERGRKPAPGRTLRTLDALGAPISAAFARHEALKPRAVVDAGHGLTAREREICSLLVAGCSSSAIALQLGISRHTVKDHRKTIFRKLQVCSLAELFARMA